jgi:2-polyprenyl-6-methoxyphenol hydroxylase-like FAD-dependent oxidoreductase
MVEFRAIIVGGGPVGMIMAHALTLAKIDFLLVEKRDEISTWTGAGLGMWSQGMRILHQMGLLEVLKPAQTEIAGMQVVGAGGRPHTFHPQIDKE